MNTLREFGPSPLLRDYVRVYQYSETRRAASRLFKPPPARPDQLMQFSFRDHYTVINRATGTTRKAPPVVVIGRQTQRHIDVMATGDLFTFDIHFQPAGFYRLFHVAMPELTNLAPAAEDVVGHEISILHEQLQEADGPASMVSLAEAFLLKKMRGSQPFHPVQTAAATMLSQPGQTNVAALASKSNLSLRQFERTFFEQVGVPPMVFGRLVRFRRALELKYSEQHRGWADVAYEVGYCDQMHLIHDCKAFAGETPSALLQTWLPCRG
jgi:AraC-like DNA-binding protein